MGKNDINIAVAVSMSNADAIKLAEHVPGAISVAEKIGVIATGLLRDLAKGGMMIDPAWAERIQTALGTTDAPAVVEAVEKSVRRRGDAVTIEWVVDPTQISFYRELAESNGMTLEQQLKAVLDYAHSQGWFNQAAPDAFKLLVSPAQYRYLQQVFEKDIVTGEDVIERLHAAGVNPAFVAEDDDGDDPVLESLKG